MGKGMSLLREVVRKLFHLSGLVTVVIYVFCLRYFSERVAILVLTALLLLLIEIDHIRIEHRPKLLAIFDVFFRRHEKNNISGAVFFVISCVICFAAFDYWIAVLAMFMTVFGDIFSALVGKSFGKTPLYRGKTFAGTCAGFSANLIVGFLVLPDFPLVFVPMAVTASFVELITIKLDDNLTVPLFAGFIGQMIVYFTGICWGNL